MMHCSQHGLNSQQALCTVVLCSSLANLASRPHGSPRKPGKRATLRPNCAPRGSAVSDLVRPASFAVLLAKPALAQRLTAVGKFHHRHCGLRVGPVSFKPCFSGCPAMLARCVRARGSLAQRALSWTPACRLQHAEADASSSALDDAAESFRESVHEFAQKQVAPHAAEIDATNAFPKHVNLWTAMGDFGLHGKRTGRESACCLVVM